MNESGHYASLYRDDLKAYRDKLFMWRAGLPRYGTVPVVVTARRLDGVAPVVVAERIHNAYNPDMGSTMLTALNFPAAGCWQVTAVVNGKSPLAFVVNVP